MQLILAAINESMLKIRKRDRQADKETILNYKELTPKN